MSSTKRGRSLAELMPPIDDDQPAPNPTPAPPAGPAIVPINILVAPEDRRRLRQLSLDTNTSLQRLGHEAWNLLLAKRGLPPLKPVTANVPSGRATSQTQKS